MNSVSKIGASADTLLGEIVDDYLERLSRDEAPEIEDYARRYPQLASVLRQTLPTLRLLRRHDASSRGGAERPGDAIHPEGPLGDFRIVREIGRGGMGIVYEAVQVSLGRSVALKVLPFASTLDPKQLQRFKNEAQAAAHLHHPNIVPVHATGCERGVHYYAMQFIEGHTLAEVIADLRNPSQQQQTKTTDASFPSPPYSGERGRGEGAEPPHAAPPHPRPRVPEYGGEGSRTAAAETVPEARLSTLPSTHGRAFYHSIAHLGIQAAEALDYSHELGVIHRDVKPANMLVDARGKLWITDFGLAHCQSQAGLTMSGDLVGTLRYMSPEQALAKRVLIDHRTDIYSLGATLYELLTGEPVFAGHDRQELLRQISFDEAKPLRRHNKAIPAELETIVLKGLEKNPADRYATAKEMAEDLERFVKDEPIRAQRPSLARRIRTWGTKHRAFVWSAAAALIVGAAVAAGAIGWVARDQTARQTLIEQAVENDWNEADRYWKEKQFAKALPALERASGRLVGSGLSALQTKVEQRRRGAALVVAVEKAGLQGAAPSNESRDFAGADRAYAAAFADFGLDLTALTPEEAARRIRASEIHLQLVTGLDHWSFLADRNALVPSSKGTLLRTIAQLADENEWRRRLRDPDVINDQEALIRMAQNDGIYTQVPENLIILFHRIEIATNNANGLGTGNRLGSADPGVKMLLKVQPQYPQDYWINFNLGYHLAAEPAMAADAIGYCRAALAVHQRNGAIYHSMATSFVVRGYLADAEAACRKAVQLHQPYFTVDLAWIRFLRTRDLNAFSALSALINETDYRTMYIIAYEAVKASVLPITDVGAFVEQGRAQLRGIALGRLRSCLAGCKRDLDKGGTGTSQDVMEKMRHWQRDPDLIAVRDGPALTKLPEHERQDWQQLWDDVAALKRRAAAAAAPRSTTE